MVANAYLHIQLVGCTMVQVLEHLALAQSSAVELGLILCLQLILQGRQVCRTARITSRCFAACEISAPAFHQLKLYALQKPNQIARSPKHKPITDPSHSQALLSEGQTEAARALVEDAQIAVGPMRRLMPTWLQ